MDHTLMRQGLAPKQLQAMQTRTLPHKYYHVCHHEYHPECHQALTSFRVLYVERWGDEDRDP